MYQDTIIITGAYQNNLKNISLELPKHKWITVTGVSGSGKSSLVFDVIYAQAQKEFLESLSAYARRSFPKVGDVNVEKISGLSPCIVIDQSSFPNTPRSTVGTYTDIYTYMRLLFSRAGDGMLSAADFSFNNAQGACTQCAGLGEALAPDLKALLNMNLSLNQGAILHKTWKVGSRYWNIIRAINFFDMDKKLRDFTQEEMDKLLYSPAFVYQNDEPGHVQNFSYEGIVSRLKKRKSDDRGLSAISYDDQFFRNGTCPLCHGGRLKQEALHVKVHGLTITDCVNMEITDLYDALGKMHGQVEDAIIPPMRKALKNLIDVGMGYLNLNRSSYTLSGGEAQKVKLAKAMGCSLSDMIYILDEPTAGLHAIDVYRMRDVIRSLIDSGNTAIVIEHNKDMILASDIIADIGPGAGQNGGELLYVGDVDGILSSKSSVTAPYISAPAAKIKKKVRKPSGSIRLEHISLHNVHDLNVNIPRGIFVCFTGVSGAGKSTILDELISRYPKAIVADQSLPGGNIRANAATYTKVFDSIRSYFSELTGLDASDFSFNSSGSCEACHGLGYTVTDMHFIGDIRSVCEICGGKRYKPEILARKVKDKTISDVLEMTVDQATEFFMFESVITKKLKALSSVGLGYITLGQPLSSFSGGELQRLKLADKINSRGEIYIFDEPMHGLHFKDTARLLSVLNSLADNGNSVIVVEHNLEVIAQSDWIIDIGPSGGKNGGRIVFEGVPEDILRCESSFTGQALKNALRQ